MMAHFQEVMRQWVRMKKAKGHKDDPLVVWPADQLSDGQFERIEAEVMAWAAENPEPIYPTWGEWFMNTDVLMLHWDRERIIYALNTTHIPADIAEKLGIEPK